MQLNTVGRSQRRLEGAGVDDVRRPAGAPGRGAFELGRLARDEESDLVLCHVCGRGFRALGSHVRVHGMTAAEYREEFRLMRTRALSARAVSRARSVAQRAVYERSARTRADFAAGQSMARSGALADRARRSLTEHGASTELATERAVRLEAGRRTQGAAAAARLAERVRTLGFDGIPAALRGLYVEDGKSLEATARALGVGNEQLRRLLDRHLVEVRPVGHNSPTGRSARVALNDLAAARRVGTDDIGRWLTDHRNGGATVAELARLTGRSVPWVVSRIRRRPPGGAGEGHVAAPDGHSADHGPSVDGEGGTRRPRNGSDVP
ncbi:MucR family transcriptional regulator [Kitasatospora sp. NPDC094015]|uniref:MucR family transcriptional regulator n=1 Tax=Kitasatospora sp. NPDC094015 TaxID=3155205 RepID=UPI0033251732